MIYWFCVFLKKMRVQINWPWLNIFHFIMKLVIFLEHWEMFKIRLFTGWSDCACTPKHTVHTPNIRRDTELFKWTIGKLCRREGGVCHNIYFIKLLCFRSKCFFCLIIRYFFFNFQTAVKKTKTSFGGRLLKFLGFR